MLLLNMFKPTANISISALRFHWPSAGDLAASSGKEAYCNQCKRLVFQCPVDSLSFVIPAVMSGYKSQRPWPDPRSEPPETRGGTVWPPTYECAYKRFLLWDDNYYLLHFIPVDLFEMWDMAFKCQISIICQMVDIANGALILRFLRSFFYLFFLYIYLSVVTHLLGF